MIRKREEEKTRKERADMRSSTDRGDAKRASGEVTRRVSDGQDTRTELT